MYLGNQPLSGAFKKLDNIAAGFNGVQLTFALTSEATAVTAGTPQNLLISISGVLQEPGSAYYVAGSSIVFTEAPLATDTFFGVLMGNVGELVSAGGGASGAVGNPVFWENDTVVAGDYTVTSGKNAGSFGPITITPGVIVTVPDGSVWTIV